MTKKHAAVESGADKSGHVLFRWRCVECNRIGVWLNNLSDVERNAAIHDRSQHAERSAA